MSEWTRVMSRRSAKRSLSVSAAGGAADSDVAWGADKCVSDGEISTPSNTVDDKRKLLKKKASKSTKSKKADAVIRDPATAGATNGDQSGPQAEQVKRKHPLPVVRLEEKKPQRPETATNIMSDIERIFLDPSNKISKQVAQKVRERIGELLLENARLNFWLARAEESLLDREKLVSSAAPTTASYAGAVKRAAAPVPVKLPSVGKSAQVLKPRTNQPNVAILSTPGIGGDPKELLKRTFAPSKNGVSIRTVRACRKGSAVIVTAAGPDDIKWMRSNQSLRDAGFKIEVPGRRRPRLLIYDLEKGLNESEIVEAAYTHNGVVKGSWIPYWTPEGVQTRI